MCISAALNGRISVKLDAKEFCEKSVRKIQTWLHSGKNIGQFTSRPEYVLLLPAALNRHKSAHFE